MAATSTISTLPAQREHALRGELRARKRPRFSLVAGMTPVVQSTLGSDWGAALRPEAAAPPARAGAPVRRVGWVALRAHARVAVAGHA